MSDWQRNIKVGDGENGVNDNAQPEPACICGADETGGPHNLACVMQTEGLRTVTIEFGLPE